MTLCVLLLLCLLIIYAACKCIPQYCNTPTACMYMYMCALVYLPAVCHIHMHIVYIYLIPHILLIYTLYQYTHYTRIIRSLTPTIHSYTHRHNGIGELLEILGSIINGFAIPLKQEHLQFLERALLPLHKPRSVSLYHGQLSYCISQFIEKDPDTISIILTGLIRYWPWMSATKQVECIIEYIVYDVYVHILHSMWHVCTQYMTLYIACIIHVFQYLYFTYILHAYIRIY